MEEVLFRAGEYLVTIVKNTDIRGGGGGGNLGYIIINDQTVTPEGTGGFVPLPPPPPSIRITTILFE